MGDFCNSQDADNLVTRHSRQNSLETIFGQNLLPLYHQVFAIEVDEIRMAACQFAARRETKLSLHQDIVPTLMQEALGCKSPAEAYSNGLNLFRVPERRETLLASYMMQAYWFDDIVFERTTSRSYDWRDMKQARTLDNVEAVRGLLDEERRFLVRR